MTFFMGLDFPKNSTKTSNQVMPRFSRTIDEIQKRTLHLSLPKRTAHIFMLFTSSYFYLFSIILQVICVIHCLNKGNENRWIWLIIFLPYIGCIAYFFTEIINRNQLQHIQSGAGNLLNPTGSIRKLEKQLSFSDTFHNRVALADAYLAKDRINEAIHLYESSLSGVFSENEHVLQQLIIAYAQAGRYADILPLAKKVYTLPQFLRSNAHVQYAIALEKTGHKDLAEKEFQKMHSRYAHFGTRYHYGLFLVRDQRPQEAQKVMNEILEEAGHLSAREKRYYREWLVKTKEELKKNPDLG